MKKPKSYRGRTDSIGSSHLDPNRIQIKIQHEDELKKFSLPLNQLSLDDLKYKMLVGFNYVEGTINNEFSFQQEQSQLTFENEHRGFQTSRQSIQPKTNSLYSILQNDHSVVNNFNVDLIYEHTKGEIKIISNQQDFESYVNSLQDRSLKFQKFITALIGFKNLGNDNPYSPEEKKVRKFSDFDKI